MFVRLSSSTVRWLAPPVLALTLAAWSGQEAYAQSENVPPAEVATEDVERIFVDTVVADVLVDRTRTVAIMGQSPRSPCGSNAYVINRERPKWLFQTGRLFVAQEQQAVVRVSFTCVNGLQDINALQFLSPPGTRVTQGTPQRERAVRTGGVAQRAIPLPDGSQAPNVAPAVEIDGGSPAADDALQPTPAEDAVRRIPLP